jgi:pyruvate dehydrogenase E1 component alpha subunit
VDHVADRAPAYGIPGQVVDGNDPDAVFGALSAAVQRARDGAGPTLVECTTFRLWGHYFGDPMRYIPPDELEAARRDEPVGRYRAALAADGVLDGAGAEAVDQAARDAVEAAFAAALDAEPPGPTDAFTDVYADASGVPR